MVGSLVMACARRNGLRWLPELPVDASRLVATALLHLSLAVLLIREITWDVVLSGCLGWVRVVDVLRLRLQCTISDLLTHRVGPTSLRPLLASLLLFHLPTSFILTHLLPTRVLRLGLHSHLPLLSPKCLNLSPPRLLDLLLTAASVLHLLVLTIMAKATMTLLFTFTWSRFNNSLSRIRLLSNRTSKHTVMVTSLRRTAPSRRTIVLSTSNMNAHPSLLITK